MKIFSSNQIIAKAEQTEFLLFTLNARKIIRRCKSPIFIFIFYFSFYFSAYAQSTNWLWAKGAIGLSDDRGTSISTDKSGNVLVTGYFYSSSITFDSITLTNAGNRDIFIVKYNNIGNVLWAKSAGGTGDDVSYGISTDAEGNVLVTGYFYSSTITFGSTTLINTGSTTPDIFIVKYDSSGNMLWAKNTGGASNDYGYSIAADTYGNVLVTGYFSSSSITFGSTTLTNAGSATNDIFIVKYDSNGNVLWAKSEGGTNSDFGYSITADTGGNVLVTGKFFSSSITFGSTTLLNAINGIAEIFVVKYDSSGNVLWSKSAGGTNHDVGYSISSDASSNILVTGYFSSSSITFGSTTLTNPGSTNSDFFIVKYNSNGNVLWAESAGGINSDVGNSITTDTGGNILVTGYFNSLSITFGSTTLTNSGSISGDIFIVKYDSIGNVLWAKRAGGISNDGSNGISTDASGNILVTGYFSSPSITFGPTILNGAGYDFYVVKLGICQSVTFSQNLVICNGQNITVGSNTYTASGTYQDTLINANGCDSIVISTITVNYPLVVNLGFDTTVCDQYLLEAYACIGCQYQWSDSSHAQTNLISASGQYSVTISNSCGSVSDTINLIINNNTSSALNEIACNNYTLNGQTYYSTGVYTQTLINALGCDSIITLNLIIYNSTNSAFNETACNNYTLNGQTYNSTGVYTQTLVNALGCDSIITLNLIINNSTSSTFNEIICDNYILNGQTYYSTGIYTQTLVNALGCDSIITLNLIINNSTSSTLNETVCNSFFLNGTTYYETGSYIQTTSNMVNCDSIINLNLTIIPFPNAGVGGSDTVCSLVTQFNLNEVLSANPDTTGIWYDNDNTGALISNFFNPSLVSVGNYNFTYTVNGIPPCNDSHATVTIFVDICEIVKIINQKNIYLYPNPTNGVIFITNAKGFTISVYSYIGKKILIQNNISDNAIIDLSGLIDGVYLIKLSSEKFTKNYKLVLKK